MLSVPPTKGPDGQLQLHASTVVLNGKAVAFVGPSGSGKSTVALAMIQRGAALLADDITWLQNCTHGVVASCPSAISGRIEARGIGLLNAPAAPPTRISLIVDLGTLEVDRLPPRRTTDLFGHIIRVFHTPESSGFIDAIAHYMLHGGADDPAC